MTGRLRKLVGWTRRLAAGAGVLATVTTAHAFIATRLPDITVPGAAASAQVDLNRDGFKDLITTSPGTNHRGIVEIRYGSAKGFKQKADFHYEGPMDWAQVGGSPMAIDVNGDGWPDLVVGASSWSGSKQYAGAILVFFGGPNGFRQRPDQVIEGPEANSYFGFTAKPLGDFNHDGYADLAVSSSIADGQQGAIFVYAGSPKGLVLQPQSTLQQAYMSWWYFGRMFDAGDIDGQGQAGIVVGSPTSNDQGRPGLVFVYKAKADGFVNRPDETLVAPGYFSPADGYGSSVAILGDVDGDGFPEIAVSAPDYELPGGGDVISTGQIFVYYGSALGFNASGRQQVLQPQNADGFTYFGEVMLGQRDVNGDGHADLLVGASLRQMGVTGTDPFPGFAWLYTGGPGGFTKAPYKRAGTPGSHDGLGATLELSDLQHDGQMDFITANPVAPSNPQGAVRIYRVTKGLK